MLSPGFGRALPESERKRLGKAGLTPEQCRATFIRGQELELQKLVANWLNLHSIYYEWDRTDKRTSGKRGRADFRIVCRLVAFGCRLSVKPQGRRSQPSKYRKLLLSGNPEAGSYFAFAWAT